MDFEKNTVSGDTWNGTTWNGGVWAAATGTGFQLAQRIPGNNTFNEYIIDDEYYDVSESTGVTWDDGLPDSNDNKITVTGVGTFISEVIALGPLYSFFTVSVGTTSNLLNNIYISADNKGSWQQITAFDSKTPFLVSDGTGVYIKIEGDGTAVTAQSQKTTGGHFTKPAIKIVFEE